MRSAKIIECSDKEAMGLVDLIDGVSLKTQNVLRLLTEEMFSMCHELLQVKDMDFEVKIEDRVCSLTVSTDTYMDEAAREEFLSMKKDGKEEEEGLKGLFGSVLRALFYDGPVALYTPAMMGGLEYPEMSPYYWSMSKFKTSGEAEKTVKKWDGMEKSIIESFADDLAISVKSGKLSMKAVKKLSV